MACKKDLVMELKASKYNLVRTYLTQQRERKARMEASKYSKMSAAYYFIAIGTITGVCIMLRGTVLRYNLCALC